MRLILVFCWPLLLSLTGCDDSLTQGEENVITPEGGTVHLADGNVRLEVPRGAVSESVTLTAELPLDIPDAARVVVGTAYDIGPAGVRFAEPVELAIRYEPARLPFGVQESELGLHQIVQNAWQKIPSSTLSPAENRLAGEIRGLGIFGILWLPVQSVSVTPDSATVTVGDTLRLTATKLDADGNRLEARPVTWTSSDEAVATVDSGGLVTGVARGSATISATSEQRSDSASLKVLTGFEDKLKTLKWITYAPTNFNPNLGIFPDEASIWEDLQVLLSHGFDGVITFASDGTLRHVPRIAREVGFEGVIMGLFMFNQDQRQEEIPNAEAAADHVDAYGVGNEGLIACGGSLYSKDTLLATMERLRNATGRPVSTSEQIEDYSDGECGSFLHQNGDWLFPIVHPFNNQIKDPAPAVNFTVGQLQDLDALTEKIVCAKETGWPTAGDPAATEQNQETYFVLLKDRSSCYAYFEAFSQPWKHGSAWEPHWGLFREDRTPKVFISRNRP